MFRRSNAIISTYVDDFIIISSSKTKIDEIVSILSSAFRVKDLGQVSKFLGINITQSSKGIRINQQDKIESLCESMNLLDCNVTNTPIADDNLMDRDMENLCAENDAIKYRSAVGLLLQIANMKRPDIQYAINRLT